MVSINASGSISMMTNPDEKVTINRLLTNEFRNIIIAGQNRKADLINSEMLERTLVNIPSGAF